MSLRRFVYLVTGDQKRCAYLLRRIDTSRFFLPNRERLLTDTPPPMEEARLPPAAMKFDAPIGYVGAGSMDFMLFAPGGGRRNRVVAADHLGRTLLYDPESTSVRPLPNLTAPKFIAASIAVGNDVYVLDTSSTYKNHCPHCFDVFIHNDGDWHCHPLPRPPYIGNSVGSYAVVGGSIWVSELDDDDATYSFDTASRAWTWAKVGDWGMPFHGPAHHVPEHGVWIGLASGYGEYGDDDGSVCVADLTAAGGGLIWRNDPAPPPRWKDRVCYLMHLGGSRFCHSRFFGVRRSCDVNASGYVVLTGIEVERRGEGDEAGGGDGELCVVKHRSLLYRLPDASPLNHVL